MTDRQICLSINYKAIKTSVKTLVTFPLSIPDIDPVNYGVNSLPASRLPILHKRMCKQEAKPQGTEEKESLQRSLKDFHLCFQSLLSPDEVTAIG